MDRAIAFFERAIGELARGLGLILQDIHRALYRRWGARIWWAYLIVIAIAILALTGRLVEVASYALLLVLILLGLYIIIRAPFRSRSGGGGRGGRT